MEEDWPPSWASKVAIKGRGSQPVGLRKKPGRSTVISILRSGSGTPPNIFGMSLVNTSTPVSVERSTTREIRITSPRSIGPDLAGTSITIEAASPGWLASPR